MSPRLRFAALILTVCVAFASYSAYAQSVPSGFFVENAAGTASFSSPTSLAFAPDGRMFVTEKGGRVMVVKDGQKLTTPFLDLRDETLNAGDRGMTSLAFDPDFALNQFVYVFYSVNPGGGADDNGIRNSFGRIVRYTANGDRADLSTRTIILDDVPACFTSHVNDAIRFASDGSLIVSTGDAASFQQMDAGGLYPDCFGPGNPLPAVEDIGAFRSQQLNSLAGKILRIDPATGQGYSSNPFYNGDPDANRSKVWAYGLRNPFSITIRKGGSLDVADGRPGSIFIGEVGWRNWEEINIVREDGGQNFGWPCYEGPFAQNEYQRANPASNGCNTYTQAETVGPALYWTNQPENSFPAGLRGDAIIVGDFYEGTRYPASYRGALFYADYPNGWMAVGRFDEADQFISQTEFSRDTGAVVGFAFDPGSGWMHYINIVTGEVLRIVYDGPLENEIPAPWTSQDIGAPIAPGTASFDGQSFTITASGELSPRPADAFHFVSQTNTGDFTLQANISSIEGGTRYARAGLMAREGLAENAPYLQLVAAKQDGVFFEWRAPDGTYNYRLLAADNATGWLRMERVGDLFVASTSSDGFQWQILGEISFAFAPDMHVGLSLTSDDVAQEGISATVTFTEVALLDGGVFTGLPEPWSSGQVGDSLGDEEVTYSTGVFSVTGSGDIWGSRDRFHWAYRPFQGDGSVRANFTRIAAPFSWSKAGLMIRESQERESKHAFLLVTPTNGLRLQSRVETEEDMISQFVLDAEAPIWLRLDRVGDTFTAYTSGDGEVWTAGPSVTIVMPENVLVGLASTATDYTGADVVSIGTFAEVSVGPVPEGALAGNGADSSTGTFQLQGIYPNPFNPVTTVRFSTKAAGMYGVDVFDLLGRHVHSERFREDASMTRQVGLDLSGHASGTYVVRVLHEETGYSVREKVVLLK